MDAVDDQVGNQDRSEDGKARDKRGQEQRRGRNAQHKTDDDISDGGRDQDARASPRCNKRTGVGTRVTRFHQPCDGHAPHRRSTRRVRAGNGREHTANKDGGRAKAALGKVGQRFGHIQKLAAQPGADQHVTCQDKQRYGGQRKGVDARKQTLPYKAQRQVTGHPKHQYGGRTNGGPDRDGKADQRDKHDNGQIEIPTQLNGLIKSIPKHPVSP